MVLCLPALHERVSGGCPHHGIFPPAYDEHPIIRPHSLRIDDQGTVELAVHAVALNADALGQDLSSGCRPIVISAGCARSKANFAPFTMGKLDDVIGIARPRV